MSEETIVIFNHIENRGEFERVSVNEEDPQTDELEQLFGEAVDKQFTVLASVVSQVARLSEQVNILVKQRAELERNLDDRQEVIEKLRAELLGVRAGLAGALSRTEILDDRVVTIEDELVLTRNQVSELERLVKAREETSP